MDKRGRGEEFGADYYWCRDVQTVGRMGGEVWERWVCPFVGRTGIIVVILDNCDVHPNCPPLWPRNYPRSSLFLIRYFRLLLTPSLFTTVIQINVHVVFTVSLWWVKAKEEFRRWVRVGAIWFESRLWMMFSVCWVAESFSDLWLFCTCLVKVEIVYWIFVLFSFSLYCHRQEEIFSDRDQLLHQKYNYLPRNDDK